MKVAADRRQRFGSAAGPPRASRGRLGLSLADGESALLGQARSGKARRQQASDQFVRSLARGLAVIRAFDAENTVMTLSEVAKRTDLTRATAPRVSDDAGRAGLRPHGLV